MSAVQRRQVAELEAEGIPPGVAREVILGAAEVEAAQRAAVKRGDRRAIARCLAAQAQLVAMVFAARAAS